MKQLLIILILSVLVLSCQNESYILITNKNGLSGETPYYVAADQDNYWLGYNIRYPGYTLLNKKTLKADSFYEVKLENGKMQPVNFVCGIIANDEYVWISSYKNGLLKFNKKTQIWKLITFDDRPATENWLSDPNRNRIGNIYKLDNKIYVNIDNYGFSIVDCDNDEIEIVNLRDVYKSFFGESNAVNPSVRGFITQEGTLKFIIAREGVIEKTKEGSYQLIYRRYPRNDSNASYYDEKLNKIILTTDPTSPPYEPLKVIVFDLNTKQVLEDDPYQILNLFKGKNVLDKEESLDSFKLWNGRLIVMPTNLGIIDVESGKKIFSINRNNEETYYYNLFIEDDIALISTDFGLVITKLDKKILEEVK